MRHAWTITLRDEITLVRQARGRKNLDALRCWAARVKPYYLPGLFSRVAGLEPKKAVFTITHALGLGADCVELFTAPTLALSKGACGSALATASWRRSEFEWRTNSARWFELIDCAKRAVPPGAA